MSGIWATNRDSKYEQVCKIPVAKNLDKTLIFFNKFWNHGTEEFSLGVIMEDVGGRTIVRYFHQKPISLFLKRPREDNRISWGYAVWPWLSENSNSPLIHFLTEQILTEHLWRAGHVSWPAHVSFLSWAFSAVCLWSLSLLSFFVDHTTVVTTF